MLKWSRIEKVPKYREDQIEMDRSAENVQAGTTMNIKNHASV